MNERLSRCTVALSLVLAGCAPTMPPAPTVAVPAVAPPPAPLPRGCEALKKALYPLERLKSQAAASQAGGMEPTNPSRMAAELSEVVAAARAAKAEDVETAKLVEDVETRFSAMVARVQDFKEAKAATREDDARAALSALLRTAEDSEAFVSAAHRRCDGPAAPKSGAGRLPPAVIQKIVRSQFKALRGCYENGLRRNPALRGRVLIHFVIDLDGHITKLGEAENSAKDAFAWSENQSTPSPSPSEPHMPDPQVIACVLNQFRELVFPRPESGIVTVTYPIMFAPGG